MSAALAALAPPKLAELPSFAQRAVAAIRGGATVVALSDGWIGIEVFGGDRSMMAPEWWERTRAAALDLPTRERMPRVLAAEWMPRSGAIVAAALAPPPPANVLAFPKEKKRPVRRR